MLCIKSIYMMKKIKISGIHFTFFASNHPLNTPLLQFVKLHGFGMCRALHRIINFNVPLR